MTLAVAEAVSPNKPIQMCGLLLVLKTIVATDVCIFFIFSVISKCILYIEQISYHYNTYPVVYFSILRVGNRFLD